MNPTKSNSFGESKEPAKSKASSFDDFIVPDDKIKSVTDYYARLRKKFIHMKQERIIKKVVEHFHLKKTEA